LFLILSAQPPLPFELLALALKLCLVLPQLVVLALILVFLTLQLIADERART
jgi:hypothetical protein